MSRRFLTAFFCLSLVTAFVGACGGDENSTDDNTPQTAQDAGDTSQDAGGHQPDIPIIDIGDNDAGTGQDTSVVFPPVAEGSSIVWMHTAYAFYKGDLSKTPFTYEYVGEIDCPQYKDVVGSDLSSVTDLAVNEAGDLYGVTSKSVLALEVDGNAVKCREVWALPKGAKSLMGLTFAPKGTLHADKEILVGADNDGSLWRIDETNGQVTVLGNFGTIPVDDGHGHAFVEKYVGQKFGLSGDIVFMSNNGSPVGFATVRECRTVSECGVDTLVEIDLSKLKDGNEGSTVKSIRGKVVKRENCNDASREGYTSMYGIAAWDAQVYGFSSTGEIVEISNVDGSACLLSEAKDESDKPLKFYGAGISTAAHVEVHFN